MWLDVQNRVYTILNTSNYEAKSQKFSLDTYYNSFLLNSNIHISLYFTNYMFLALTALNNINSVIKLNWMKTNQSPFHSQLIRTMFIQYTRSQTQTRNYYYRIV